MVDRFGHLTRDELEELAADQALVIAQLEARNAALAERMGSGGARPSKTSSNSHPPPSSDRPSSDRKGKTKRSRPAKKKPRPSRPGVSRRLASTPDEVVVVKAERCARCSTDVSGAGQRVRRRDDHVEPPAARPVVTRVELLGGRRPSCGARFCAEAPADMPIGTPFGPSIQAMTFYLHHAHHIGCERLSRLAEELWGLMISEGAIGNPFARGGRALEDARAGSRRKFADRP